MENKFLRTSLIIAGILTAMVLFIGANIQSGDFETIVWQFTLLKIHLASEWSLPYFTPSKCGGWLFMADAQSLIFSIYTLLSFAIPNAVWASKIGNILISGVFALGLYFWLKEISITNKNVRIFASMLAIFSGSWLYHMSMGGLWMHGLAYIPWIMIIVEKLLVLSPSWERQYLLLMLTLTGLFFLLINSGYIWLQVFIPIISYRCIVEFFTAGKNKFRQTKRGGMILLAGMAAILLSLSWLGAVYEFQMTKFPRAGNGVAPHYQIIGDTKHLITMLIRSFFDAGIVVHKTGDSMLGFMQDYTNFIGLTAIIPLLIGFFRFKELLKNKIFLGLVLATIAHLLVLRTTHAADLARTLLPVLKSVTWHWRGNIVLVLVVCILIAAGYETILRHRNKWIRYFGITLMFLNLTEIVYTARHSIYPLDPPVSAIMQKIPEPTKPLETHYALCLLGCIFGYGNEFPRQISIITREGEVVGGSVYSSSQSKYYNAHDIRKLFGPEANGGYYMTHQWPLWPKTDSTEFEKFINYKQVVPTPLRLKIMINICMLAWITYVLLWICVWKTPSRSTSKFNS